MKKIPTLFQRNYGGDRLVRDEVTPGTEWVIHGEGYATRKYDGTCCMVRSGTLYKRHEVKMGKTPPADFEASEEADPLTGKMSGWRPVVDGPEDKWHKEAFHNQPDGTYELCGPRINGNPEGYHTHVLVKHGVTIINAPRDFGSLKSYLEKSNIEGIVWYHPDGRMVKIKTKDFGLKRNI